MAWKSQRTRALDLATHQAETAQHEVAGLRSELAELRRQHADLHAELARRDVELIGALAHVTAVTDQLRIQNEADRAHHERLDRAIELLTMLVAATPAALDPTAGGADGDGGEPAGATVIGGSVDPSRLDLTTATPPAIDLSAETTARIERADVPLVDPA
ncbi:MAG: hypothetical protein ACXVLO_13870 [Acidimicrobiia bacterium]